MTKTDAKFDPSVLNKPSRFITWFDDFNGDDGNEPTNNFRFLSNFYIGAPILFHGVEFMTGEHVFQAYKTLNADEFAAIAHAPSPGKAKYLGRKCKLRSDWEKVKLDLMAAVVRTKFTLDRAEGVWLLGTGDALLVEGTYWKDEVWGVDLTKVGYPGRNWLGSLLMTRRAELRAEQEFGVKLTTAQHNMEFLNKG